MTTEIIPWFRRQGLSRHGAQVAASELFAYFRGDLAYFYMTEMDAILSQSGMSIYSPGRCFKLRSTQMRLNEFSDASENKDYRSSYKVEMVWVKGQDVQLKSSGLDPFLNRWHQVLWNHAQNTLAAPNTRRDLVQWLNGNSIWRERLLNCQTAR